ncbi:MAG: antitoxin Xre/MbcA/ParS toxin-binding domain-containing protein [Bradymonadaceae bacterium]
MTVSADIDRFLGVGQKDSPADRISKLRSGLPYTALEMIRNELDLSLEELAGALAISPRTLNRRKEENTLKLEESDRVFRLVRVYAHALDVFGTSERAARWFKRANPVLEAMKPLEVFDTDLGAQIVDDLLTRIEYGVYS